MKRQNTEYGSSLWYNTCLTKQEKGLACQTCNGLPVSLSVRRPVVLLWKKRPHHCSVLVGSNAIYQT